MIELTSQMYCEGVNHFWLDLSVVSLAGAQSCWSAQDSWSDAVLSDLRLLLKRLPGLEGLAWNDGTPLPTRSPSPGLLKK
ncbi:type VI secretion system domain-containing protein [Escherichia coli]|nr:type VI secretion system domain-containing protein [Escherichia coli]